MSNHAFRSGARTNSESLSLHGMENQTSTPVSNFIVNHQSVTPNTNVEKLNTPLNPRAKSNLSVSSQASAGASSLSNINYTTNNNAILETFVEYRNLKRDLHQAQNQIQNWKSDYSALSRQMEKLKNSSFRMLFLIILSFILILSHLARPTADGRVFIEQLLESLKSSEEALDKRSLSQLSIDIGVPESVLLSCSKIDPQKSALHVFNFLFPTNEDKDALLNVANVMIKCPDLLDNIFGK